jgi:hypothetical protein
LPASACAHRANIGLRRMPTPRQRPAAARALDTTPTPPKRPAPSVAASSLDVGASSGVWVRTILSPISYDALMGMTSYDDGRVLLVLQQINGWYSTSVDRSSAQWLLITPTRALDALGVKKGEFEDRHPIFLMQVRALSDNVQVDGAQVNAAQTTKFLGFCTGAVLERLGA